MQLSLWAPERTKQGAPPAPASSPAESLAGRLVRLGLPETTAVVTHRNRRVMVSWVAGKSLRVHEGYAHAPDEVIAALVRFLAPGSRRPARLAARRVFLGFPVEQFAPSRPRVEELCARPGDESALARLSQLHLELNHRHFAGSLSPIPIGLSGRMRRRLGEVRLDRRTGRVECITLSRRHLRRDGWAAVTDTLLHEMVHQWQAETGRPVDHGGEFRRRARELGITPRATIGEIRRGAGVNAVSSAGLREDGAA